RWVVSHAPECDYTWIWGDDDLIEPGRLADVMQILRDEQPVWLFLPHHFVRPGGELVDSSPAPGTTERYASSGALFRAYHHWSTLITGSVVRSAELRAAKAAVETDSRFEPVSLFFRAGS